MPNARTRLIAGNWKMNKNYTEGVTLAQELANALADGTNGVEVVVCPPAVDLKGVSGVIEFDNAKFGLGAQNCYWEAAGAYTGETSIDMIKNVGCTYCIIGHSERRDYFHETDADINKKTLALVAQGVVPILCCGESLEVREAGGQVDFVVAQIKAALEGVELESGDQLVIAYEPIWAIGTGKTATPEDAQEVCGAIRATLVELYGTEKAESVRVLYGGSAKPGNVAGFLAKEDVDGALVGGASLVASDFAAMVSKAGE
jgi:triosephosphate isomerase